MATPSKEFYDGLSSFPDGINSGIDPVLLPKSQVAYAINATFRGTFLGPRPEFLKRTLTFPSPGVESVFLTGLFQGSCPYQPDTGNAQHVVSISGRLFAIDLITYAVTEVSIQNDLNPPDIAQVWMRQAERWVIVKDGISDPIFYDGVSSRRAIQLAEYGTVGGTAPSSTTIPADGTPTPITVLTPGYTGPIGAAVLIGLSTGAAEIFQVVANSSTFAVNLTSINDTIGTTYPKGTQFIANPNIAGIMQSATAIGFSGGFFTTEFVFRSPFTGGIGSQLRIAIANNPAIIFTVSSVSGSTVRATYPQDIPGVTYIIPQTTQYAGPTQPTSVAFTLTADFASIATGSSAGITLGAPYTGVDGALVWVGTKAYSVFGNPTTSSPTSINLVNNNGVDLAVAAGATIFSVPEIPPGRMGTYGMGRNWDCLPNAISYVASDIVGGPSGSANFNYRDGVLKMVENNFLAGGGSFSIPVSGDQITAMRFMANLDTSLGQGPLQIFTQGGAFSVNAPVDRDVWEAVTNPLQTQSMLNNGSMSQNATILDNSDIIFRSPDGFRSFLLARRDFNSPGNVPFSREISRLIADDNPALLAFASAINFDNRSLLTARPVQSATGVYWTSLAVKNNDPLSTIKGKLPAIWEGEWTGLNCYQIVLSRVLLVDRAYAYHKNLATGGIELYEILPSANSRAGDVEWSFESPSLFQRPAKDRQFQHLTNGEMWVDNVDGAMTFQVFYRADDSATWTPWLSWSEDANTGTFKPRMGLGQPPSGVCDNDTGRYASDGYMFFVKKVFTGKFRYKGSRYLATVQEEPKFKEPKCQ